MPKDARRQTIIISHQLNISVFIPNHHMVGFLFIKKRSMRERRLNTEQVLKGKVLWSPIRRLLRVYDRPRLKNILQSCLLLSSRAYR